MNKFRKWCRILHRDFSFFFAGVIIIYGVSGLALNHKKDFNTDYSIKRKEFVVQGIFPISKESVSKDVVVEMLKQVSEEKNYLKHYFPSEEEMKVFIRGGSSLTLDMTDGSAVFESVKKRPILSSFSRLHYNPGKWWTVFSDIFAIALILIILTGLVINKGKNGLWGRGGIEFIAGIIVPLVFIFFF